MKTINVNITIDILKKDSQYFCRILEEGILIPLEKGMRVLNTQEGLMREDFVYGEVFGKPIRGIIATTPLRQHRPKIESLFKINEHGDVEWRN